MLTLGGYGTLDFFRLKGCIEAILSELRVDNVAFSADSSNPAYHPGRCAVLRSGDTVLGTLGQVHPLVAGAYDLDDTYVAEIDLAVLLSVRAPEKKYVPLPRFPAISRDIAVVCDSAVPVAVLAECIKRGGGALLKEVTLFDIYTGSPIPEGKKSTAFSLVLRSDDQTLTDEHADEVTENILALLKEELGAVIR